MGRPLFALLVVALLLLGCRGLPPEERCPSLNGPTVRCDLRAGHASIHQRSSWLDTYTTYWVGDSPWGGASPSCPSPSPSASARTP